uniref:NUC153 domain-containing protein n=1 Tax=Panagrellus redivivus TaxID=6233 RepID=A0A7E4V9M0_PANRE
MDEYNEPTKKQIDSQNKRLNALREKQDAQRQRQKLVSEALKTVDSGQKTKRIVFNDSSDEDEVPSKKKKVAGKVALFGGSDDEDADIELQNPDELINSRFSGKGSGRLMHLESTFGNDDRFKLDNNFLEEYENEEDDATKKKMEKERQMRLLSMVVGRDIRSTHKEAPKKSVTSVRPFQRFDPENPEHVRWMEEATAAQRAEDSDDYGEYTVPSHQPERDTTAPKAAPVVDPRRFFEIDQDFAAELRGKLLSGKKDTFSFLKPAAKDDEEEEEKEEEPVEEPAPKKKTKVKVALALTTDKPYFFIDIAKDASAKLQRFQNNNGNNPKLDAKWKAARDVFDKVARNLRRHKLRDIAATEKEAAMKRNKPTATENTKKIEKEAPEGITAE